MRVLSPMSDPEPHKPYALIVLRDDPGLDDDELAVEYERFDTLPHARLGIQQYKVARIQDGHTCTQSDPFTLQVEGVDTVGDPLLVTAFIRLRTATDD